MLRVAENLVKLGPMVAHAVQQVICPLTDVACGPFVGGAVAVWLDGQYRHIYPPCQVVVALARHVDRHEAVIGEYHPLDLAPAAEAQWRVWLAPEGEEPPPAAQSLVAAVLAAVVEIEPSDSLYVGEIMRRQATLIVPFALFHHDVAASLPAVQVNGTPIRLFDYLVKASITEVVQHVQTLLQVSARAGGRSRAAQHEFAEWLAGYRPDPRAQRRLAGGAYLAAVIQAATRVELSSHRFFEVVDDLSRMLYERTASAGAIAFASVEAARHVCTLRIDDQVMETVVSDITQGMQPIVSELRVIRKLLHGASPEWPLMLGGGIPMGWVAREAAECDGGTVLIEFKGAGKWRATYRGKEFLSVIDGQVQRAVDMSPTALAQAALAQVRDMECPWNAEYILDVVTQIIDCDHGALLVFMDGADEYVRNRSHSCIRVAPTRLDPQAVASIAKVDGAMIFSTTGECQAIAAILDGESCGRERIDRGARYNAALRFCAGHAASICVVISDDGVINVMAGQPPQP